MPACSLRRGSTSGPVRPIFTSKNSRPSRGRLCKASPRAASLCWLARGGEIKARDTSRGSCEVSHDDWGQACARQAPAFCQLGAVAEAAWGSGDAHIPSIAMRQPRPPAVGAHGAPHFPLGFASKPSPSTPWARGLLSASWEWGSPDLPTCGPRRGSPSGPVWPIFTSKHPRPLRGAKPREADDTRPPQGQPH